MIQTPNHTFKAPLYFMHIYVALAAELRRTEQSSGYYYSSYDDDNNLDHKNLSEFIDNTRLDSYTKSDWIFIGCVLGIAPIVVGLTFFFMFSTVAEDDEDADGARVRVLRRDPKNKAKVQHNYQSHEEEDIHGDSDESSGVSNDYSAFEEYDEEEQISESSSQSKSSVEDQTEASKYTIRRPN